MSKLWSDRVHGLSPYVPGEQPDSARIVKLNTNENPYPPSPRALALLQAELGADLARYPDPSAKALRRAAAERRGLPGECAFAGNGSDEVLALAFAAFFGPRAGHDGPLLFPDVSYSFYPVWANFFDIPFEPIPLAPDFTLDLQPYRQGEGGIIFPNPNAPTAMALALDEIEGLLADVPDRVVVIDEAYVDFGTASAAALVERYANLLVVQTVSKSHSLAGLRVGFALGQPHLIEGLDRVKSSFNSYPVDRIADRIAREALADEAWFAECRDRIVATRDWTVERMSALGFEVLPSSANFVFARHPKAPAADLFRRLREHDIVVRWFDKPRLDDHLRITIGTDEEMKRLVAVLEGLLTDD